MNEDEQGPLNGPPQPRSGASTYTHNGKTLTLSQWMHEPEVAALGITIEAIRQRLKKGWSVEKALSTPKTPRGQRRKTSAKRKKSKRAVAEELDAKFSGDSALDYGASSAPTTKATPATVAPLRLVLIAGGVEVAESNDPQTWAEVFARVQAKG